jgi:hypothetical protein
MAAHRRADWRSHRLDLARKRLFGFNDDRAGQKNSGCSASIFCSIGPIRWRSES